MNQTNQKNETNQTNQKNIFINLFAILTVLCFSTTIHASTYIAIEDTIVYDLLNKLEAESVIQSGLLNTKPISRKEAFRLLQEAEANSESRSEFIKNLIRTLKDRLGPDPSSGTQLKPIDSIYAKYIHTNAEVHTLKYGESIQNQQPFNYNNNGDLYQRGSNERIGFTSRLENWGPLSLEVNPEFRYPDTPFTNQDLVTRKAYAVLDLGWDVVLGQDSQWWGPGYHGALLLSNNAEPFTMLKISNPSPVRLPWIFDSLGPFGFTFFVTNLEKARKIPEPYLYGMRFDFKPHPNVEIGLQKTAFLGGRAGRPENAKIWLQSLYGANDADNCYAGEGCYKKEPGDQRAGIDFKLTVPWNVQPMQIYLEADGEDEYHNLPNLWAFIGGIYLPRILNEERLDFRMEYTTTRGRKRNPYIWYLHHLYSGYTYNGNIIGHHVGTDANDFFSEVSYLMQERTGKISLSYHREEHDIYIPGSHERLEDITAGIILSLMKQIDLVTRYSRGWLKNKGNAPGDTVNLLKFGIGIEYRF